MRIRCASDSNSDSCECWNRIGCAVSMWTALNTPHVGICMQVWHVDVAWEIWWSFLNTPPSLPCPHTFFTSSFLLIFSKILNACSWYKLPRTCLLQDLLGTHSAIISNPTHYVLGIIDCCFVYNPSCHYLSYVYLVCIQNTLQVDIGYLTYLPYLPVTYQ